MDEIPEDIMAYAKEFWRQGGAVDASPPLAIARAILAERERCAEIIRPLTVQGGVGGAYIRRAAWSALDAIRATPDANAS